MSGLRGLWLVTARELSVRARSKAYLLSGAFGLVLLGAAILLPQLLGGGPVTHRVGTLGEGSEPIVSVAESVLRERADDGDEVSVEVTAFTSEEAARAALAAGDVELVVVDGRSILRQGSAGFGGSRLQDTVQEAAAIAQLDEALAGSATTVEDVVGVLNGEPLPVSSVQGAADEEVETARSLVAYGGMFLLYMAVLLYGQWTLQAVTEEKSSRVVEVLLATLRPWQLLAGKVIGVGLLGLAQFAVTIVWALLLVTATDALTFPEIPIDSAVSLIIWFILGYGLFSVLYAGAGALVSRSEDAQSVAGPVAMVAVVGFLVSFQVLDHPAGALARTTTFIPVTAPFVVPIRVAFGEIGLAEHVGAALVTVVVIAVSVRIAARIYAGGLLHFGSRLGLRQAWRTREIR